MPQEDPNHTTDFIVSYKCPGCGSRLVFDADSQQFHCKACGNYYDLQTVTNSSVNTEGSFDWGEYNTNVSNEQVEGTVAFICSSCGAETITDATTAATRCPYCDNYVVVAENVTGLIKPNAIIPFKINSKGLQERIADFCKGKKLLPKNFLNENKIKNVKGIYVPFWLFSCKTAGTATFETTRIRTWSTSDYNYTETSFYYVTCDGSMKFSRIPVDGSLKIDDALMDSIEPFNYEELVDFDAAYMSGYLADRFDVSAEDSLPRASQRVRNSAEETFRSSITSYASVRKLNSDFRLSETGVKYVLLPVYLIVSHYGGKEYRYAVNGQTGKVVGDLPISKKRSFMYWGITAAIVAAIASVVLHFFI